MKLFTGENPAAVIKLFSEDKRDHFLSPEELRRVNEAIREEPNEYWRTYFPLVLILGTRKSELLAIRWIDVDLEQRTLRLPMTKAGRSHILPLPSPVVEIIASLSSRGRSEWVFPSRDGEGHAVEASKAWQRIPTRAALSDVRLHDLRCTLLKPANYSDANSVSKTGLIVPIRVVEVSLYYAGLNRILARGSGS